MTSKREISKESLLNLPPFHTYYIHIVLSASAFCHMMMSFQMFHSLGFNPSIFEAEKLDIVMPLQNVFHLWIGVAALQKWNGFSDRSWHKRGQRFFAIRDVISNRNRTNSRLAKIVFNLF